MTDPGPRKTAESAEAALTSPWWLPSWCTVRSTVPIAVPLRPIHHLTDAHLTTHDRRADARSSRRRSRAAVGRPVRFARRARPACIRHGRVGPRAAVGPLHGRGGGA